MSWQLRSFPFCTHHVFLSHCSEDRAFLVIPLYEALEAEGIVPWLDIHDYTYGPTSFEALRNGVLRSRHSVFLVTPALLKQPRGWSIIELAWAHLLQENLREPGRELLSVALPLVFVDPVADLFMRSAWRATCDRCAFYSPGKGSWVRRAVRGMLRFVRFYRPRDGDRVTWALGHIRRFVRDQQRLGVENEMLLEAVPDFRARVEIYPGMLERITCRHPPAILPT